MPSSRELSRLYQLSRGIVNQAYDMLRAEGYIEAEIGRGTFVSFRSNEIQETSGFQRQILFSDWGRRVQQLSFADSVEETAAEFDFRVRRLRAEDFPLTDWQRSLHAVSREYASWQDDPIRHVKGDIILREAISQHLRRAKGIHASPEEIVIVNGSMQAIALFIHLLIQPGDAVVLENPCYRGTLKAVQATGGVPIFSDVDRHGMAVEDWPAKLLFVTPNRQYPTGAVLSLERRQQLLQWANKHSAFIVEDDYDSEFRLKGRPVEPLKVLDRKGVVVYIGTFSKTLLPEIRIGYAVLPGDLVSAFANAKQLFEPYPTSLLEQRTLARFMNSGLYERHLRKLNKRYREKYNILKRALKEKMADFFEIVDSDSGSHLFAKWTGSIEQYHTFRTLCEQNNILWTDATVHYFRNPIPSVNFGFSHLSHEQIEAGIAKMAAFIHK